MSATLKEFLTMLAGTGTLHFRVQQADTNTLNEFWLTNPGQYTADSLEAQFATRSKTNRENVWVQISNVQPNSKIPLKTNVIWADLDTYKYPGGEAQALALIAKFPLKPTMIIRSGRGLHLYWKLKEPVTALGQDSLAQRTAKSVQWQLGGDPAHAPNKVLRVPTTFNFKPDEYEGAKECVILEANDTEYHITDFPVDQTLAKVGHKLMLKVVLGPENTAEDRSSFDFATVSALFRLGLTEDEIKYLFQTYKFSGKYASEGYNARHYMQTTVEKSRRATGVTVSTPKEKVLWVGKSLQQILLEDKPDFIIDGFLPEAGIAVISGPPKARKSWCVMQMARAVAMGKNWLGFPVTKPRKVAYVQAELPNWMVAERFYQMYGEQAMENITFFHVTGADLTTEQDLDSLLSAVTESGAELVIIDPIANFWQGDENSSSSVNKLFDQLVDVQKAGTAVVLVHHARKTQANEHLSPQHMRGSNVFFARPDAIMTLSPMSMPDEEFTFADFALRAAEPKNTTKLYVDSTGKFSLTHASLGDEKSPVRKRLEELKRKREQHGQTTENQTPTLLKIDLSGTDSGEKGNPGGRGSSSTNQEKVPPVPWKSETDRPPDRVRSDTTDVSVPGVQQRSPPRLPRTDDRKVI